MRALIIHRQQSFLEKVKAKFLSGGWAVHTTPNGLDGLMATRHHAYDLILCGFELPVISGMELVRSLRLISANQNTPVFFLSPCPASDAETDLAGKLNADLMLESELETNGVVGWIH